MVRVIVIFHWSTQKSTACPPILNLSAPNAIPLASEAKFLLALHSFETDAALIIRAELTTSLE